MLKASLCLLAATGAAAGNAADLTRLGSGGVGSPVEGQFREFLATHGKMYMGAEYEKRLSIFEANLARFAEHQKNDPTAKHGVTMHADLTADEFREQYLGTVMGELEMAALHRDLPEADITVDPNDIPDNFDWRSKGAVTPVKNQGQCGSCWSFSTSGCLEGANFIKNGKLVSLSEQQLVDCDHECMPDDPSSCDAGCNGGLPSNAMSWIMKNGGLTTEEAYPYRGVDDTCQTKGIKPAATVANFTVVPADEDKMKAALYQYGPLSIGINAAWMQSYLGGVSCPLICVHSELDHGVLITGYGTGGFAPSHLKEMDFWSIKNSWGPMWGEQGYYRICRGQDACGLAGMVVSAIAGDAPSEE